MPDECNEKIGQRVTDPRDPPKFVDSLTDCQLWTAGTAVVFVTVAYFSCKAVFFSFVSLDVSRVFVVRMVSPLCSNYPTRSSLFLFVCLFVFVIDIK